jgi:hypothetical protein
MKFIETYWWLWLLVAITPLAGLFIVAYLDSLFDKLNFYWGRRVLAHLCLSVILPPRPVDILMGIFYGFSCVALLLSILIKIIRYAAH